MCNAIITNDGVREPSKMTKTFAMMDASNTVQILVVCAMMQGIRSVQLTICDEVEQKKRAAR